MADCIVCELGRMGDIVASEPIYRFLKAAHPDSRLIWYTTEPFAELLRYAPFVDETRTVRNAEEYGLEKRKFPADSMVVELNFHHGKAAGNADPQPGYFESLLKQFAHAAGLDNVPDETPVFHFSADSLAQWQALHLPERYAVFHCVSNGKSRQWQAANFRKLANLVRQKGIPVIEIGFHEVLAMTAGPLYRNLTGKQSLQLLAQVIAHAQFFVGVESGFGHIANAVGVPMVIISGKLRAYKEYTTYSGRAGAGEQCNIVRWFDEESDQLPYEVAEMVLRRLLDGRMMTGSECEAYCLKTQIEHLQQFPPLKFANLLAAPFRKIARSINAHNLRNR